MADLPAIGAAYINPDETERRRLRQDGRPRQSLSRARKSLRRSGALCPGDQIAGDERLPYFALVAHGLELALKAILIRAGWDEERLMMIGHDLDRCHVAVARYHAELAVIPGVDLAGVVDALAYPHAMQSLRYPQAEPRNLPDPAIALDCLCLVLDVADRHLRDGDGRAQGAA